MTQKVAIQRLSFTKVRPKMEKFAVGIDLGTTYCAVAVYRNKNAEIISNEQGNRTTPSCVAFTSTQRIVGEGASYQAVNNPENTIYGVKRLMGRTIDDHAIERDIRAWPFAVVEEDGHVKVAVKYKGVRERLCPEQISAAILEKMKSTAEAYLNTEIKDVVITCPAYFNNSQRQATKDAATIAGLNVLRMINEPTAAAMAYGLSVNNVGRKNVLIFDFGGGTFDVSIVTINDQDYKVRATNGDTHLGGEDFDQRMVDHFVAEFLRKNNRDISEDKGLMRNLKVHCERAKRTLSTATEAKFLLEGTKLTGNITRARFEDMNDDLFKKAINLVRSTLQDADMTTDEIDDIVLVGGSSRIPKIQEMLSEFFGNKKLCHRINPDEAVALGAAIQAGMLQSIVSERLRGLKLCDVCPLSLGTKIIDGSVLNIIKRNTPIPAKASNTIYTVEDNQTHFLIQIFEGERVMAKDNHFLGKFTVTGIPPKPRGEERAINTCEIDENGILKVTSVIPSSGATNSMIITNKSRLTKEEAKRLADEAAKFREEDAIHEARLVAYNSFERFLFEVKRKVSALPEGGKQKKAQEMLEDFSKWFKQNSLATKEEFVRKKRDLEDSWKLVQ